MHNQKELFREYLLQRYCQYIGKRATDLHAARTMVDFIVSHNIVPPVVQRRFIILHQFHQEFASNGFHKTNTVMKVAMDLGVHENTVWTVLKDHQQDFEPRSGES